MWLNSVSNNDMARCSISACRCTPIRVTTEAMEFTFEDSSVPCLSVGCGAGFALPTGAAIKVSPSEVSLVPAANSHQRDSARDRAVHRERAIGSDGDGPGRNVDHAFFFVFERQVAEHGIARCRHQHTGAGHMKASVTRVTRAAGGLDGKKAAAFDPHIQRVSGRFQIARRHIQMRPFEHPKIVRGQVEHRAGRFVEHIRNPGVRHRDAATGSRLLATKPGCVQVGEIVGRHFKRLALCPQTGARCIKSAVHVGSLW